MKLEAYCQGLYQKVAQIGISRVTIKLKSNLWYFYILFYFEVNISHFLVLVSFLAITHFAY